MNKKKGYTIAGITAAIIAAASFMPAPDDNPPLASQSAPQATTANTEWTPKTTQQRKAEQAKAHRQAKARGEETSKGLTMLAAAHACNQKATQAAAENGVNWNGNPDIDLQLHKIIGKDTFSIAYGATAKQPGASKTQVKVFCQVSGTEDKPQVENMSINPSR